MTRLRHTKEWYFEPASPVKRIEVARRLKHLDPTAPNALDLLRPKKNGSVGKFAPSNKWMGYHTLESVDAGYITPLYSIRAIGKRYGLSQNSRAYFKRHLLPEPFAIVRVRSTQAHHYSKFVLMALDVVLKTLERQGTLQFLKTYEEHVELLHQGIGWMTQFYEEKAMIEETRQEDRHGVVWYQ